jgi:hypothetical protein
VSRGGACEGDYSVVGQRALSLVDTDSFGWPDIRIFRRNHDRPDRGGRPGERLADGVPAGNQGTRRQFEPGDQRPERAGERQRRGRGEPGFYWVRLAQRVPVRIHLDVVPEDIRLVQGMTATVQIHPRASAGRPQQKKRA